MFLIDLLFALFVALILGALVVALFGWRHPGQPADAWIGSFLFLLLILFLISWAGGVWIGPFGPMLWGESWLPFLLAGLIAALLVIALAPPMRSLPGRTAPPDERIDATSREIRAIFGVFFWLLVIGLIIAIALGYFGATV